MQHYATSPVPEYVRKWLPRHAVNRKNATEQPLCCVCMRVGLRCMLSSRTWNVAEQFLLAVLTTREVIDQ